VVDSGDDASACRRSHPCQSGQPPGTSGSTGAERWWAVSSARRYCSVWTHVGIRRYGGMSPCCHLNAESRFYGYVGDYPGWPLQLRHVPKHLHSRTIKSRSTHQQRLQSYDRCNRRRRVAALA
jgi:hypothetical protein